MRDRGCRGSHRDHLPGGSRCGRSLDGRAIPRRSPVEREHRSPTTRTDPASTDYPATKFAEVSALGAIGHRARDRRRPLHSAGPDVAPATPADSTRLPANQTDRRGVCSRSRFTERDSLGRTVYGAECWRRSLIQRERSSAHGCAHVVATPKFAQSEGVAVIRHTGFSSYNSLAGYLNLRNPWFVRSRQCSDARKYAERRYAIATKWPRKKLNCA